MSQNQPKSPAPEMTVEQQVVARLADLDAIGKNLERTARTEQKPHPIEGGEVYVCAVDADKLLLVGRAVQQHCAFMRQALAPVYEAAKAQAELVASPEPHAADPAPAPAPVAE